MEVSSGASWSTTVGLRQWSVSLNENDGAVLVKNWEEMKWSEKMKALQKRADLLVIKYMREQDAITSEFAEQRKQEIIDA